MHDMLMKGMCIFSVFLLNNCVIIGPIYLSRIQNTPPKITTSTSQFKKFYLPKTQLLRAGQQRLTKLFRGLVIWLPFGENDFW